MSTAEQIRRWRKRRAMSQVDLAKQAGVSPNTVWRLEQGMGELRPSTLRKLATALGVEPTVLLDEDAPAGEGDNGR